MTLALASEKRYTENGLNHLNQYLPHDGSCGCSGGGSDFGSIGCGVHFQPLSSQKGGIRL